MIEPIIHDHLTQIFGKHYKMAPKNAAEEALRFMEILELYDMKLIIGAWVIPEDAPPLTGWDKLRAGLQDIEASGREPWLAKEIQ